ncbi:MAG: threonine/serine dehydratase [Parvularcula sp.]|jgi:threonine dehydratase|nr:threonine/serine dehydratase [Parvularcula sp.]
MADNLAVSFADIEEAASRIEGHVRLTPLLRSDDLDRRAGGQVLLKAECLQETGSFKLRGAMNHVLSLPSDRKERGVVAYSSGNHAQGVARAAKRAGIPAVIVMPADAPKAKRQRTEDDGAEVVTYDRERESREEIGQRIAEERGATLIPPYDHPKTIAGQGTAGLELAHDAGGTLDQVLICCSGGGLAAGVGLAVRQKMPNAEIIVVEPQGFDDTGRSLAAGQKVTNGRLTGSICDALLAPAPGDYTLPILKSLGASGVSVSDEEVLAAMRYALFELKLTLEPGGAVALAAVLKGRVPTKGRRTAVLLSGGNCDPETLRAALNHS